MMAHQVMQLSPRETEVLKWTACGKTSNEIAGLLAISVPTVNTHVRHACLKLDAVNKTHAAAIALVHGVIPVGPSSSLTIPLQTLLGLSKRSSDQRATAGAPSHRISPRQKEQKNERQKI